MLSNAGWLTTGAMEVVRTIEMLPADRVQNPNERATLVYKDEDKDATGLGSMVWPRR